MMGLDVTVYFCSIDPSVFPSDVMPDAFDYIFTLLAHEKDNNRLYTSCSRWAWIQYQLMKFCDEMGINGLDFVRIENLSFMKPQIQFICLDDLHSAIQALEKITEIMIEGQARLNTDYPRDIEDQAAFAEAQVLKDIDSWDVKYPTSSFIKSLIEVIKQAISQNHCLLYVIFPI
jgi:hypothetical protein